MIEWNIQSRAHLCEACSRPFADKQAYYTLLFDERAGLRRQDVCAACWSKTAQEAAVPEGLISRWQGVYEAPPPRPVDPIQRDTAETLLRKLIERNEPRHAPAAYILAVMLERKRLLKVKEQLDQAGRRVFIYEHPKTGDVFSVADPQLRLDQLEQVQHDVAHLLEHGLPDDRSIPSATSDAAEVTPPTPTEPSAESPSALPP